MPFEEESSNTYAYINRIDDPATLRHHDGNISSLPGITTTCYPESVYQTLDDVMLDEYNVDKQNIANSDCDVGLKIPQCNPEYHVLER